jgi:hypothetical protein
MDRNRLLSTPSKFVPVFLSPERTFFFPFYYDTTKH